MKRFYYLLLVFFVVSFISIISCEDDDDANNKNTIVGTWRCEELIPVYYEDEVEGYSTLYFQFFEDGSLTEKDVINPVNGGDSYIMTSTYGKWSVKGDVLTLITSFKEFEDPSLSPDVTECKYKIKNGKLILSYKYSDTGETQQFSFIPSTMPQDKTED